MINLSAYAKVNLTLEVISKRNDGYHEIASVLQTISLSDALSFEPISKAELVCHADKLERVEMFEGAVLKAAELLKQETGCCRGARITLQELGVPRAAGLGSSASVPASVLKGLNDLWSLKLPLDALSRLATRLGSDAPFFIYGGTALAKGRGEQITPLPPLSLTWLVMLKPNIDIIPDKTKRMYAMLNASHFADCTRTLRLVGELEQGRALHSDMLCNTFEHVAFDFFPELDKYRRKFLHAGASRVHLAGAGPTLFTLVPDITSGETLTSRLRSEKLEAYLVHTV
jgi:4-diphosphocytidyl-2-C-methyl-D-erythritol kinase